VGVRASDSGADGFGVKRILQKDRGESRCGCGNVEGAFGWGIREWCSRSGYVSADGGVFWVKVQVR